MTLLLVPFGLIVLAGVGTSIGVYLHERGPRPELARQEVLHGPDAALLTGGVVRAVDATVVGLVERGLVEAEGGRLAVRPDVEAALHGPRTTPGPRTAGPRPSGRCSWR